MNLDEDCPFLPDDPDLHATDTPPKYGIVAGISDIAEGSDPATRAPVAERHPAPKSTLRPALPNLPPAFWQARKVLDHISRAAHARGRSRDLVFAAVLARLAAMVSPELRFDTGLGTGSLNMFVIGVGPSGTGKSTAAAVARVLLEAPRHLAPETDRFRDGVPIGSGEGLVETFMGLADQPTGETKANGEPKLRKVRAQVRRNAFVCVDEGETLVKIGERSGATIGPILRSAWIGELLGQANAREETTRILQAGSYSLGLLVGFQPGTALPVLAEAGPGTPQRFLWVAATDPSVPAEPPHYPGPLSIRLVDKGSGFPLAGTIEFAESIRRELWAGNLARVRGEVVDGELDSHRPLQRSKIASLLALLEQRLTVDAEDWDLAGQVVETSAQVRDELVTLGERERARETEERTSAAVERAVRTAAAVSAVDGRLDRLARNLAAKVRAEGRLTHGAARRTMAGRDRGFYDAAVDRGVELNLLVHAESGLLPGVGAHAA